MSTPDSTGQSMAATAQSRCLPLYKTNNRWLCLTGGYERSVRFGGKPPALSSSHHSPLPPGADVTFSHVCRQCRETGAQSSGARKTRREDEPLNTPQGRPHYRHLSCVGPLGLGAAGLRLDVSGWPCGAPGLFKQEPLRSGNPGGVLTGPPPARAAVALSVGTNRRVRHGAEMSPQTPAAGTNTTWLWHRVTRAVGPRGAALRGALAASTLARVGGFEAVYFLSGRWLV
ncbi:hypothetical protein SKAU_G00167000 [Synaphobranchus kaupii]|uniref:Uncharacterized protein n=1 Tax=Synaphobranchus kaupii TaxID=118154 RepID=A0A9Q1FJM1_SYNKA|nr:hypothetical protein SKAU_G00167000 [Synaphobranchus kaupii]